MDIINKLIKYVLFCCFWFPSVAYSSWASGGRYNAKNIETILRQPSKSVDHLLIDMNYQGTKNGVKVYVPKKTAVSKFAFGKLLKKFAFGPYGFALSTAMELAGWLLDQTTGEYTKTTAGTPATNGRCYSETAGGDILANVSFNDCLNSTVNVWGEDVSALGKYPDLTWIENVTGNEYPVSSSPPPGSAQTEVADGDDYVDGWDSLSDQPYEQVFTDPVSMLPNSNTNFDNSTFPSPTMNQDPFDAVARHLDTYFDYENDGDPLTDPETLTDPTDAVDEAPTSYTEDAPVEQFDLCAEHPEILACQSLGEADAPVDIVTEEIPFSYTPVSLSGSAYCPAPQVFELSSGDSYSISNQPICDFATGINGVVIIICSMIGMYIVSGGVRNG